MYYPYDRVMDQPNCSKLYSLWSNSRSTRNMTSSWCLLFIMSFAHLSSNLSSLINFNEHVTSNWLSPFWVGHESKNCCSSFSHFDVATSTKACALLMCSVWNRVWSKELSCFILKPPSGLCTFVGDSRKCTTCVFVHTKKKIRNRSQICLLPSLTSASFWNLSEKRWAFASSSTASRLQLFFDLEKISKSRCAQ